MKLSNALLILVSACSSANPNPPSSTGPDAAPPPPPPPAPDAAQATCQPSVPSTCSGETICVGTACEPAFNRIYHFSNIAVTVASKKPNGDAWDPFGGAPDPQVSVKLNGTEIIKTAVHNDTFATSFTETADVEVVAGSTLALHIGDSDSTTDDTILDCTIDPLGADLLREHGVSCVGSAGTSGSSITMQIDVN